MPVTVKRTVTEKSTDGNETEIAFKRFIYKRHWFMLSQTDGTANSSFDSNIALLMERKNRTTSISRH